MKKKITNKYLKGKTKDNNYVIKSQGKKHI